ncbi:MAG: hypothetical protein ACK4S4_04190 [Pyrinomonadaceae bacterium]
MNNTVTDAALNATAAADPTSAQRAVPRDAEFELGMWLSGVESFFDAGSSLFADRLGQRSTELSGEIRVARSVLLLCATLANEAAASTARLRSVSREDLDELSLSLCDAVILSGSLAKLGSLDFGEWRAFTSTTLSCLRAASAFEDLIANAEKVAESDIPPRLHELLEHGSFSFAERSNLRSVVMRYSKARRWISEIEDLLRRDEPLKHSVLLFARVHEQIGDVVRFINNRLNRSENEDSEIFRTLDTASYTSSHELRKVFDDELSGILAVRPAPTIFARIGTAASLLKDGIEQVLLSVARLAEPGIRPDEIFPHFKQKFEFSLLLRSELAGLVADVSACEGDPSKARVEQLSHRLAQFSAGIMPALYYKDRDTFERFVEEIRLTSGRSDLVPILHRFGAYLETLFGHVNNRTILSGHPFDPSNK